MHLPVSLFLYFEFLVPGWVNRICTHPLYFLAFLKIRQKVYS